MAKNRLNPQQIVLDQPLPWDVYDETGQLLLCRGYTITRESQREVLLARGLFIEEQILLSTQKGVNENRQYNPFRLWDSILDELEALLRNIRMEKDFEGQILSLAKLIHILTERSADTSLAAMILTDQRRYPIVHSVHVGILCDLVTQRLGWNPHRRISVVCASMTMNLAMLELQMKLCAQRVAPTAAQRAEIIRHPQLAAEMLASTGVKDEVWLRAVREHHEIKGGKGYPYGVADPCEEGMLIQTADIFSAKVSPRAARKPISAPEAARSLFLESAAGERNSFISVLIKEIGIFPPGTFVRLANGEIGVVMRRGEQANAPQVLCFVTPSGTPYGEPVLRQTSRKPFDVAAVVPREMVKVRIDIEKVWRAT